METRLITRKTRPHDYELIALRDQWLAANDRHTFERAFRRKHWILAALAWCGESGWRIAGLIAAALVIGSVLDKVLP